MQEKTLTPRSSRSRLDERLGSLYMIFGDLLPVRLAKDRHVRFALAGRLKGLGGEKLSPSTTSNVSWLHCRSLVYRVSMATQVHLVFFTAATATTLISGQAAFRRGQANLCRAEWLMATASSFGSWRQLWIMLTPFGSCWRLCPVMSLVTWEQMMEQMRGMVANSVDSLDQMQGTVDVMRRCGGQLKHPRLGQHPMKLRTVLELYQNRDNARMARPRI